MACRLLLSVVRQHRHLHPPGRGPDVRPISTTALPAWIDRADLDQQASELARNGVAGALNRYRNMDRDWEDLAAWDGVALKQPSLFVAGVHDPSVNWMAGAITAFSTTLPGLRGSHLIDGCGHWVHQERPDEVNELLVNFLRGLPAAPPAASRP